MAAFYGGIMLVIVGIVPDTFALLNIPDWVARLVIVILLLGFPIAIGLTWVFDITEDGIVRTRSKPGVTEVSLMLGRVALAAMLLITVAVSYTIWDKRDVSGKGVSLAVMPFENWDMSGANDYFSDGITEEIIDRLAAFPDLKVIARTSVMQYKGTEKRAREIGKELGVSVILQGSVRRTENRVRITGQLIDVRTEGHLWVESYDREVDVANIFELQAEVARKIASSLRTHFRFEAGEPQFMIPTRSPAAYDLYLRAKHHIGMRTGAALRTAIVELMAAIEADSLFGDAYAELATVYNLIPYYLPGEFEEERLYTHAVIERALELNPASAGAYVALAVYDHFYQWDMDAAEAAYLKAIELDPQYAPARHWYALFLADVVGDLEASLSEFAEALDLDPKSPIIHTNLGDVYFEFGHYEEAEKQYWKSLDLDPDFGGALQGMGLIYMQREHFEQAKAVFANIGSADLGWAYAMLGEESKAEESLKSAQADVKNYFRDPVDLIATFSSLGMQDSVEAYIRDAIEQRSPYFVFWRRQLIRGGVDSSSPLYQDVQRARQLTVAGN
ncbi:MAG: tetratricopeptide repeat protein [Candidatus Marinimicrobia bacterium]|nr:tetratricopeptide repeat protein [Candidatus Neomarinimicrobiota bacterium]